MDLFSSFFLFFSEEMIYKKIKKNLDLFFSNAYQCGNCQNAWMKKWKRKTWKTPFNSEFTVLVLDLDSKLAFETRAHQPPTELAPTSNKGRGQKLELWTQFSLHTVRLFVYTRPEIISPKVMTALWWQPLKPDPPVWHALPVTLSWPTTAAGLFFAPATSVASLAPAPGTRWAWGPTGPSLPFAP